MALQKYKETSLHSIGNVVERILGKKYKKTPFY